MKLKIINSIKQSKAGQFIAGTKIGKYSKTIIILFVGVFLGWLFFSGSSAPSNETADGHNHAEEQKKEQIWTCSMHPQIRQDKPGKCPICGMDLIPLDDSSDNDNPAVLEMSPSAVSLANILTEVVKSEKPQKTIYLNGKIEIDERNLHRQITHFPGRIEELYINFTGQKVNKGQKIARIYSPDLVTAQKELFEAIKLKTAMPNIYISAKEKLKLWKLTDKQINDIEKSGKVRDEIDVLADASGFVIKRYVTTGSQVETGTILFEIADLRKVWVVFDIYEEDIRWVKVGDVIDFSASSMPGKMFKTRVKYVEPLLNAADRTIKVWTEYRNINNLLKPEVFVKGILKSSLPFNKNKIIIPKPAVLWTGKRSIVYIKVPDSETPAFEMREVTLGDNLGDAYIIEDGLQVGEEIVVNGAFKIDAAAQLSGKYSSMNQPKKQKDGEIPDFSADTPAEFKSQLNKLILAYIDLTDALVASNSKKAKSSMKKFSNMLKQVDMSLLSQKGHIYWMKQKKTIKEESEKIAATENIDSQRKAFIQLSQAMINSAKTFGTEKVFYVVHCPMANDEKGAEWLSLKKEVLNPYFGDMMLNCGDVVDKIK